MENIISDKAIEAVMTRIDVLAEKLGITAKYLFGVYVKQAYVEVMQFVIFFSIWTIVFATTMLVFRKSMQSSWDNPTFCNISVVIGGFISFVLGIVVLIESKGVFPCYFTPEYFAFNKILANIK